MIRWRYIASEGEDAAWGLAADEFLMNRYASWSASDCSEPTLRIYTHRTNCALVGRYQNAEAEVNLPACEATGTQLGRRLTGGGAVVMGTRQIMVALATSVEHPLIPANPAKILQKLARGMTEGLAELGIAAEYRPKNDVVVGGKKITGTALNIEETGAFLYHASLMLDFDIPFMLEVLKIPPEKVADKGIRSAEERLTTVSQELGRSVEISEVREALRKGFERAFRIIAAPLPFSAEERAEIDVLAREKYRTDEWTFQRQPAPDMVGEAIKKTPAGLIHVYAALAGDVIKSVLITGDFFSGNRVINDIEAALKWGRADKDAVSKNIRAAISSAGSSIEGFTPEDLASIVSEAVANAKSNE